MKRSLFILVFACFLLIHCKEAGHKPLLEIPENKVGLVGYGSLMKQESMEHSLGHNYVDSTYRVHLQGYERNWNYLHSFEHPEFLENNPEARDYRHYYIAQGDTLPLDKSLGLNLSKAPGATMNAVLFFLTPQELEKIDRRETGYERIEVQDSIAEFRFSEGKVYAYMARPEFTYTGKGDDPVLIAGYVNMVEEAVESLGEEFLKEYKQSTRPIPTDVEVVDTIFRVRKVD
ncbi:hypothetical protein [Zeaxanthinibacter enoshimensis]|uniref:hypothetical protein n=1 Tax=Zeaxanthinibacter enoshimensis TaxID=392009 RepID=UPI0035651D09